MKIEYTIQKLAQLAKVSTRTLRYYDEIGLLNPNRINDSGYRIYGESEVDRLQQILFYKELEIPLKDISEIMKNPEFDEDKALEYHYQLLLEKKSRLEQLIKTVELTQKARQGGIEMKDIQKFEGFKKESLQENEKKYGKEIRGKYGDKQVEKVYEKFNHLTKEQYEEMEKLGEAILDKLRSAMETNDSSGEVAQELAKMHRQWLSYTWPNYSKEAHAGLAQMYIADERFTAFYDERVKEGATKFLSDAIQIYTQ